MRREYVKFLAIQELEEGDRKSGVNHKSNYFIVLFTRFNGAILKFSSTEIELYCLLK